jgi:hypothetical protein
MRIDWIYFGPEIEIKIGLGHVHDRVSFEYSSDKFRVD